MTAPDQRAAADVKGTARWRVLVVLCAALFLVNVDNTIVNVALPTIGDRLSATTSDLQWVVDAFAVVFAGFLFAAGGLGDRIGHRPLLLAGLLLIGGFAVVSAFASSVKVLVGARALMGLGAALVLPATLAILTAVYREPALRAKAIGAWTAVAGLAVAAGPVAGGWLLQRFWWGSVLLVNVPIAAATLIAVWLVVPGRPSGRRTARRFDVAGSMLSIAAVGTLVWAVIEGPRLGWASAPVLVGAAAAVLLGVGFAWRERTAAEPMLDLRLLGDGGLRLAAAAISVAFFALLGFVFLATQFLQLVLGYGTLAAGACIVPAAVGIGVGSGIAPGLAARFGPRPVMVAGLVLMSGGLIIAATLTATSPIVVFAVAIALLGLGVGVATAPGTELIVAGVPRSMAGVGSAINDTTRELGGTLGVAVIGSVAASVYRDGLTNPTGVPTPLVDAARDSLPVALRAAEHSPLLAAAARDAFVAGLSTASIIAAAAVAVTAVGVAVAAVRARGRRPALPSASITS